MCGPAAGAELQALVRHATNWALDENLNHSNLKDIPKDFHPTVTREHFMQVLATGVKPAFGAPEEQLATYHKEGIFGFGPRFEKLVKEISAAAQVSKNVPKATILLHGVPFASRLLCVVGARASAMPLQGTALNGHMPAGDVLLGSPVESSWVRFGWK